MRNVLILGCGRSGTSMAASLFSSAGYYFGNNLIPAREANPIGFYEDREINAINNQLLEALLRTGYISRVLYKIGPTIHRTRPGLWLAAPLAHPRIRVPHRLVEAMKRHLSQQPYCLKDPRFTYTLDFWKPFLAADTRYLVVFRKASRTVDSILREASEATPPLPINRMMGYFTWYRQYQRLLSLANDDWLFTSYDQIVSGDCASLMSRFFETDLNFDIVDRRFSRAKADSKGPLILKSLCDRLYARLMKRAEYDAARMGL